MKTNFFKKTSLNKKITFPRKVKSKSNFFKKTSLNKKITFPRKVKSKSDVKAVSLMISYVILISLGIIISISAYSWIKHYPDIIRPPVDCKDGTSIILVGYNSSDNILRLYLKNNGLFTIDGIILQVENDTKKEPTKTLNVVHGENPLGQLKPGEIRNVNYTIEEGVAVLKIQPYMLDENDKMIICMQSIIREDDIGGSGGEEPPEEPPEDPIGEPVVECSTLDSPNTNYILMNSIANNSIEGIGCIIITAQNITFDCQSYDNYIKSNNDVAGIYFDQDNITIKNCKIILTTEGTGILINSNKNNITNNLINYGGVGIKLNSFEFNYIEGNQIEDSEMGIYILGSNNKIINNEVSSILGSIDGESIYVLGSNNDFINNNLHHSRYGFRAGNSISNNNFTGNRACDNIDKDFLCNGIDLIGFGNDNNFNSVSGCVSWPTTPDDYSPCP